MRLQAVSQSSMFSNAQDHESFTPPPAANIESFIYYSRLYFINYYYLPMAKLIQYAKLIPMAIYIIYCSTKNIF